MEMYRVKFKIKVKIADWKDFELQVYKSQCTVLSLKVLEKNEKSFLYFVDLSSPDYGILELEKQLRKQWEK
jgi:hypothetical protein